MSACLHIKGLLVIVASYSHSRPWPRAGRTIYEWEQSLEEVNLYIETPPGLRAESIDCKITPKHIRLGVKGNPPFIDVRCWLDCVRGDEEQ